MSRSLGLLRNMRIAQDTSIEYGVREQDFQLHGFDYPFSASREYILDDCLD